MRESKELSGVQADIERTRTHAQREGSEAAAGRSSAEIATYILGALATVALLAALYLIFVWVPTERVMGVVQRIFYFHIATAWLAFVAFFIVFIGSLMYLWKGQRGWDILAVSAAEIGVLFTSLVLMTGPIWAKVSWGTWWTWDPRLTTSLILWAIYVAYLMLRSAMNDPERKARLSAVFGIIGFVDVPIVFMSIRWWRTIHPLVVSGEGMEMDPAMTFTMMFSIAAFSLLFAYLLMQRMSLESTTDEVESLKQDLSS